MAKNGKGQTEMEELINYRRISEILIVVYSGIHLFGNVKVPLQWRSNDSNTMIITTKFCYKQRKHGGQFPPN